MFKKYVSNVPVSTGNNYIIEKGQTVKFRARAYFRPNVYGEFSWRFYFCNTLDSTFADGKVAYRNKPGGTWRINAASVAVAPDSGDDNGAEVMEKAVPVSSVTPVTFNGNASKTVSPDECFWSDAVTFRVEEGSYLVWEWEIEGDGIPFTPDSQVPTFCDWGDGWKFTIDCPLPAMLGCDRKVKKTIAFLGDSITQGCATTNNRYEMWVAKISFALGADYAVWNLGMGYGRGSDCATNGAWLRKAKQCDMAVLAFGVNDLESGTYRRGRSDTAEEFLDTTETLIKLLLEAGVEVIPGTVPPFSFQPAQCGEWRKVNRAIPKLAEKYGLRLYDIERSLDASPDLGNIYTYGAHPNAEGGTAAAQAFIKLWETL